MKNAPNSKVNLDRAIERFAGDSIRAAELRGLMANAIVAQLIGDGVVKGGTGLRFRYGDKLTRMTMDLDTAWRTGLDEFIGDLRRKLEQGWNGFSGEIRILRQATPHGIPFEYIMQPCDVKLKYRGVAWYTVSLEIGHNEIGDADECDQIAMPEILAKLFKFAALPVPSPIPAMRLEYQVAQKLHGASAPNSKRVHDLIDLQLIMVNAEINLMFAADLCRKLFKYRQVHAWPPVIIKGEGWETTYNGQRNELPVLSTVDEAIEWANDLIRKIEESK